MVYIKTVRTANGLYLVNWITQDKLDTLDSFKMELFKRYNCDEKQPTKILEYNLLDKFIQKITILELRL